MYKLFVEFRCKGHHASAWQLIVIFPSELSCATSLSRAGIQQNLSDQILWTHFEIIFIYIFILSKDMANGEQFNFFYVFEAANKTNLIEVLFTKKFHLLLWSFTFNSMRCLSILKMTSTIQIYTSRGQQAKLTGKISIPSGRWLSIASSKSQFMAVTC